jgi:hypothetical protein
MITRSEVRVLPRYQEESSPATKNLHQFDPITAPTDGLPAVFRDYAGIWRAAEKIVYSRTLQTPRARGLGSSASSTRTRSGS